MKPILLALAGMTIYSLTGVIIEQRLEKFSTVALVLIFIVPMVPIAVVWLFIQHSHGGVKFPSGGYFWLACLLGVLYFFADYFYLGAFTSGGNAVTIATIAILAPVLSALVRYFWVGGLPNAYQVAGYILAAASVLLLVKGGTAV